MNVAPVNHLFWEHRHTDLWIAHSSRAHHRYVIVEHPNGAFSLLDHRFLGHTRAPLTARRQDWIKTLDQAKVLAQGWETEYWTEQAPAHNPLRKVRR